MYNKYAAMPLAYLSFDIYFSKLHSIHDYGTSQQVSGYFYHKRIRTHCDKICCNI